MGVPDMKIAKLLIIFFLVISLSSCFQQNGEIKVSDMYYKTYIEDNILNVGYGVQIENKSTETYSLVIPKLIPEIEELLISRPEMVSELAPNSTNSLSASFTVDVTKLSEVERTELQQKNLITGFYISKYYEISNDQQKHTK